jgi:hypothetical protein
MTQIPGVLVELPVRTRNPNNGQTGNSKLAAIIRGNAKAKVRAATFMVVAAALKRRGFKGPDLAPWLVRITRVSTGRLDPHDGLGAALKGCIDGAAEALGIDDGDEGRIRFQLEQRRGKRGQHLVEILLQPKAWESR